MVGSLPFSEISGKTILIPFHFNHFTLHNHKFWANYIAMFCNALLSLWKKIPVKSSFSTLRWWLLFIRRLIRFLFQAFESCGFEILLVLVYLSVTSTLYKFKFVSFFDSLFYLVLISYCLVEVFILLDCTSINVLFRGYQRPMKPVPGDTGYFLHAHQLVLSHPTSSEVSETSIKY